MNSKMVQGGLVGGLASDLIGGNPYSGAMDEYQDANQMLGNYLNQATSYLNPYYQAGTGALPQYQNALDNMKNPSEFYNQMMSGYQESPAAKFRQEQSVNSANARAAATGLSGSSNNLDDVSNITQGIIGQDQQQYFNNLMGINNNYMSGLGGLSNMGMGAAQGYGNLYSNFGNQQANMYDHMADAKYAKKQQDNNMLGDIAGSLASLMFL